MSRGLLAALGLIAVVSVCGPAALKKLCRSQTGSATLTARGIALATWLATVAEEVGPLAKVVREGSPEAADRAFCILEAMTDSPELTAAASGSPARRPNPYSVRTMTRVGRAADEI